MLRRQLLASAAGLALGAGFSIAAFAEDGADWVELEKPLPGGDGKLVKLWSYDCPFCWKYDVGVDPKIVPLMQKATGLEFDMYHIERRGRYGRAASELFAWLELKDRAAGIGVEDPAGQFFRARSAVYTAYHRRGERWPKGEAAFLKTGLDAAGEKAEAFAEARRTAEVQGLADLWAQGFDAAKRQGIPAYVVNARWLLLTTRIRSVDSMAATIAELAKKPA